MPLHRDPKGLRLATPLCAKIRPLRRGRPGKAPGLRRTPLRDCTILLASSLPRAITAIADSEYGP
jgi:hypothetical protein